MESQRNIDFFTLNCTEKQMAGQTKKFIAFLTLTDLTHSASSDLGTITILALSIWKDQIALQLSCNRLILNEKWNKWVLICVWFCISKTDSNLPHFATLKFFRFFLDPSTKTASFYMRGRVVGTIYPLPL